MGPCMHAFKGSFKCVAIFVHAPTFCSVQACTRAWTHSYGRMGPTACSPRSRLHAHLYHAPNLCSAAAMPSAQGCAQVPLPSLCGQALCSQHRPLMALPARLGVCCSLARSLHGHHATSQTCLVATARCRAAGQTCELMGPRLSHTAAPLRLV